jgi:hypothetical protein
VPCQHQGNGCFASKWLQPSTKLQANICFGHIFCIDMALNYTAINFISVKERAPFLWSCLVDFVFVNWDFSHAVVQVSPSAWAGDFVLNFTLRIREVLSILEICWGYRDNVSQLKEFFFWFKWLLFFFPVLGFKKEEEASLLSQIPFISSGLSFSKSGKYFQNLLENILLFFFYNLVPADCLQFFLTQFRF